MTQKVEKGQKWEFVKDEGVYYTKGEKYSVISVSDDLIYMEDNDGMAANGGSGHEWTMGEEFFSRFSLFNCDIKSTLLEEAGNIVSGARRSAYGTPEDNFERIARFWQAYFENTGRGDVNITAQDVSPLMRLMKEARLAGSPNHRDSFVDIIGYTLTGAEVNGVK